MFFYGGIYVVRVSLFILCEFNVESIEIACLVFFFSKCVLHVFMCISSCMYMYIVLCVCAECLMACFRVCAADNRSSEEDTKRWGMLALINQLLKVYFRINKLHLCKPLIRAIESSPYKDHFALAQQITYKFFVGRKAMFDSNYKIGKYIFL